MKKREKPVSWKLIHENKPDCIDRLFNLYSEDKSKARVYFFLNPNNFIQQRRVLFEETNGDFRICDIVKKYGISSNSRMYSSEKTIRSISYSKKRFYHYTNIRKKHVQQLNLNLLNDFIVENGGVDKFSKEYIKNKFSWVRYLDEGYWLSVTFNVIMSKKLFNEKAMIRHQYQCPYPIAKFVHEFTMDSRNPRKYLGVWREMRKQLINIENLKESLFWNQLFQDTCNLSRMVNEKVNCSWSEKRLKLEHDKWSKIVTNVMIENEPLKVLEIDGWYRDFAKYSGYKLLETNHDILEEGKRMNHCVGTYINKVEEGRCAIYRVFGCTLELTIKPIINQNTGGFENTGRLYINQYQDYNNTTPPIEYVEKVEKMVDEYNANYGNGFEYKITEFGNIIGDDIILPF